MAENVRTDFQRCAERLEDPSVLKAIAKGRRRPPDLSSTETLLAMYIPQVRKWETETHRFREFGTLYLTSERLIWEGGESGFEVPLAELSTAGLRTERHRYFQELHIGVGPSRHPSYTFEVGKTGTFGGTKPDPGYDFFLETLKAAVQESERSRSQGLDQGGEPSAADELEKFAKLRDQGVISDAEFEAKKSQLLGL